MCVGAAIAGARPVVDFMFVDFGLDAFGDLINQASRMRWMSSGRISVPVVIRACIGLYKSGSSHHSGSYYSFLAHQPGFPRRAAFGSANRERAADDRAALARSRRVPGAPGAARAEGGGAGRRLRHPVRPGRGRPRRERDHDRRHRRDGAPSASRPPSSWRGRASRWRWSTRAPWRRSTWRPSRSRCTRRAGCWWWRRTTRRAAWPPTSPPASATRPSTTSTRRSGPALRLRAGALQPGPGERAHHQHGRHRTGCPGPAGRVRGGRWLSR